MKDSYQEFIDYFHMDRDALYQFGLHSVISADYDIAEKQYIDIKKSLLSNSVLSIRGYGRNGSNTNLFIDLYKSIFDNSNIKLDPTNNAAPRRNISSATGYRININLFNYQVSHIWGKTKNPLLFESVWNICFTPRLIDPFTGHECKGGWNDDFVPLFRKYIYDKFGNLINDYNDFVLTQDIQNKICAYTNDLLNTGKYDNNLINRFKTDALDEWELISL